MADYPDLRTSVQAVNLLVSGGQRFSDLEFDLTGPSLAKLEGYSQRDHGAACAATPGFVDVDTTLSVRQPELQVQIPRDKASIFGIHVRDIASALRTLVGGEPISTYREEQEQIDVWLRAQRANRSDPRAIGDVDHRHAERRAGAARQPRDARARSAARRRSTTTTASAR